ncbi:Sec-independent protein translocase subunit TatA [Yersinia aldovae]|uniref:Probable Sec-independent protein translocase protein TatE n=1 Tax=Yersinia aldovae TaxID=29483 RepID=A0A0T9UE71_YERAL|nr:Sec-independent protein translocase subunit TatA [Yersinia aldovae]AJJ63303.1 twin arginine-targeting translocase, TatA/E family protein [Yersinia aldovae 670-83]EEP96332.1 Sec-independent protein translocase protein tatE [Yersinia aldovae ATCC 35236]CNJ17052.1 twin arginine translocase protein A [Yersinia aldovae]CNL34077.1 twin arginine translocase protein A [Yersinia aldovae]CNL37840.1 twin arginine translocase protein A [Yersinia aldovae]
MEGISITKLLVVGILIVLLFGTSKLRTLGADLGAALKGFKKAMGNDETPSTGAMSEAKTATETKTAPPVEHKD